MPVLWMSWLLLQWKFTVDTAAVKAVDPGNIFKHLPDDLSDEVFETIVHSEQLKIERIVSSGHRSPDSGWYDQEQDEWVMVLKGEASILFENKETISLKAGDYITIAAHNKHRVIKTSEVTETVWLAIHY